VGVGAVTAGFGVGEDTSGAAGIHPAASNITSVRGIKIIDSFFILVLLYLSLLDTPYLVSHYIKRKIAILVTIILLSQYT